MHGFKRDDEDVTGFLAMNEDKAKDYAADTYKMIHDLSCALKFPSMNIYNVDSFGTPQQWKKFFEGEDELSAWKFKLMKIKHDIS